MRDQDLLSTRRREITGLLKILRDRKDEVPDWAALRNLVYEDFERLKLEKMRRGLMRERLRSSLLSQPLIFLEHEPTQSMVLYELHELKPHWISSWMDIKYAAVYASMIRTPAGRVYLVRITGKPHLIFIKAHLWDRYQERLQQAGQRSDAILKIFYYWHQTMLSRKRERAAIFRWDSQTLEQKILIPDGLMLGSAARFPRLDEFLDPKAEYKDDYTAVVVLNTFVTPDMLTEEQMAWIAEEV